MALTMDENTFLNFYKNTILGYSKNQQRQICDSLEKQGLITFDRNVKLHDPKDILYYESKADFRNIIISTTENNTFSNFYELYEYVKLYKYSVPLFYETDGSVISELLDQHEFLKFDYGEKFIQDYVLNTSLKDTVPSYYIDDEKILLKFVLQKTYYSQELTETVDYRYPIVLYFDTLLQVIEIRYDAFKYNTAVDIHVYEKIVQYCLDWLQENLHLHLFDCEHGDAIDIINDKQNEEVKIYKQMMEMGSGGSAELTASESRDYVLPFVGEIRELIDENEDLFYEADEVKQLLLRYLSDKEDTASYPYIYVKWIKPVDSQSYIVKIVFDYFNNTHTLLQHITGSCKDLGMRRMNDAIEYLCKSNSFVKGIAI